MADMKRFMEDTSAATGLTADEGSWTLFGDRGGYQMIVSPAAPGSKTAQVRVSVSRNGAEPDGAAIRQFVKSTKRVTAFTQNRTRVDFVLPLLLGSKKALERLPETLDEIADYLRREGYESCCQACGQAGTAEPCMTGGVPSLLCGTCYGEVSRRLADTAAEEKPENLAAGLVGALLGSLLGMAALVLIGQLGYVAAISGLIMAVCALRGYEKLGGRLSGKGIAVSIVLVVLMTYLGNQMDWAVSVYRELKDYYDLTVFDTFRLIPDLIAEDVLDGGQYYGGLAMQYLFVLLGAVPTIRSALRNRKLRGQLGACRRLGRDGGLTDAEV